MKRRPPVRPDDSMRFLRTASIASTVLTAALAGCGDDDAKQRSAARSAVTVKTFSFDPDPLRVEPGTRVKWTNEDATVHTVTTGRRGKPDGRVDGKLSASGGEFGATFAQPGTYRYFCSLHSGPGMEAKLVVE